MTLSSRWPLTQHPSALMHKLQAQEAEIAKLTALLKEARQYVSDTVGEEDMEVQTHSAALLAEIDKALANKQKIPIGLGQGIPDE